MHQTKILILRILKTNGEQTAQQVSEAMGMRRETIHNSLVDLCRWGFASRRVIKESKKPQLIYWRIR
jgi:predicted ArsR family transcriptional regulator